LTRFEEALNPSRPFPVRADIEHKWTPGLTTGDETGQGFWGYLFNIRTEAGSDDPYFSLRIAKLIHLGAILEFDRGFVVPLLVVKGNKRRDFSHGKILSEDREKE